jgi:hypothetical protein
MNKIIRNIVVKETDAPAPGLRISLYAHALPEGLHGSGGTRRIQADRRISEELSALGAVATGLERAPRPRSLTAYVAENWQEIQCDRLSSVLTDAAGRAELVFEDSEFRKDGESRSPDLLLVVTGPDEPGTTSPVVLHASTVDDRQGTVETESRTIRVPIRKLKQDSEASEPEPTSDGCQHGLPSWGVTRQFDFGQFVILYKEEEVNGKRIAVPMVLTPEGDIPGPESTDDNADSKSASRPVASVTGGVPLHLAYETEDAVALVTSCEPTNVAVESVADFLRDGSVTVRGTTYSASLLPEAKLRLEAGQPVIVIGYAEKEGEQKRRALIRLVPSVEEKELGGEEGDQLLASGRLSVWGEEGETKLSSEMVGALLAGKDAVVPVKTRVANTQLVRLRLAAWDARPAAARPAAARYHIHDLARFIAEPAVPGADARPLPVELTAEVVQGLRTERRSTVDVGGVNVDLIVSSDGLATTFMSSRGLGTGTVPAVIPDPDGATGVESKDPNPTAPAAENLVLNDVPNPDPESGPDLFIAMDPDRNDLNSPGDEGEASAIEEKLYRVHITSPEANQSFSGPHTGVAIVVKGYVHAGPATSPTVKIGIGSKISGSTRADAKGNWEFSPHDDFGNKLNVTESGTLKITASAGAGSPDTEEYEELDISVVLAPPDTELPAVSITFPPDGATELDPDITVQGTASDVSGVQLVRVAVDDKNALQNAIPRAAGDWSEWTKSLLLTPGAHAIIAQCADKVGKLSYATNNVTVKSATGGEETGPKKGPKKDTRQAPTGLQVAILLPWRQSWTLGPFSRGSLLSSIALAPGEETIITVSSWERRAKALEQSTETETEQQMDFTQTTRDTEDVFRELTNRHDFQWQLHGELDASYSNAVASINVVAGGNVDRTESLSNVCRTTNNHIREVTGKASARVRSKRITKITESVESGFAQDVQRRIRNPNECHTLTLDFHEVLAHYTVDTKFLFTRVRIVVLIPNPISVNSFNNLLVRKNETALRDALLDPALGDGFEACRLLDSYKAAKKELRALYDEAKEAAELDKPRVEDEDATVKKPPNPHESKVIAALKEVAAAAKSLKGAQIDVALKYIKEGWVVGERMRTSGQQWMFVQLCRAKIAPAFVNALFNLAGVEETQLNIQEAQRFVNALPGMDAHPSLNNLNDLSDADKEQAGLGRKIDSQPDYVFWNWAWWTGRCREEFLYRADDAGLAAKADTLRQAWLDYQAKASEGEGIEQMKQLTQGAEEKQQEASYLDKLEMKYGVEVVAGAKERSEALLAHLNDHLDYYRYVLFQALPPGEQLSSILEAAPNLRVGMFEPHVVATNGPYLAVPMSPLGEADLANTVSDLKQVLKTASDEANAASEAMADNEMILPTPGVSVESWLGECSGCEEFVEKRRENELRRGAAEAEIAELEAARRKARLDAKQLEDPDPADNGLRVRLEPTTP